MSKTPCEAPYVSGRKEGKMVPFPQGKMSKPPCEATLIALLRACAKNKDLHKGIELHADVLKRGLLRICSDAVVSMYAKCGVLAKAEELLDTHKSRDVVTWTTLIAGYTHKGQGYDALCCFERMRHEGLSPDCVTFVCILKACGNIRAAEKGEQIHDEIARHGLLLNNIVLGTALVDMYARCGALAKAEHVCEELQSRNVVSWSALIAGYVQHGQGEKALNCFERMQLEGVSPNTVTFSSILKACGSIGAVDKGEQIHSEIAMQGLLVKNSVLGTTLVDMYVTCGALAKAQEVCEELHIQNVVTWSALIAGYVQHGQGEQALNCFEQMQREAISPDISAFLSTLKACGSIGAVDKGEEVHNEIARWGLLGSDSVLGTALVDMYAKCAYLAKAKQVLEELPIQDGVSWSALIAEYVKQGQGEQALKCFEEMRHKGLSPDAMTLVCILKVCGSMRAADKGAQIHDEIARQGLLYYDIVLGTALVDMYARCGAMAKAQQVFGELNFRNVVSWSALIAGYVQHGQGEEALNCFEQMQLEGLTPNDVTFLSILKACGSIGAVDKGEQIHAEIARLGLLGSSIMLDTALVDMYAKCGSLSKAQKVLEELTLQDVVSWSALISGYAEQGQDKQAFNCFEQMQRKGLSPDGVTYVCILKACGNIKAAGKGEQIHDEISRQGLLVNNIVLGTALVDMYAKCGALVKAQQVCEELRLRNVVSWSTLIAGYVQYGQGEQALNCCERMQQEGLSPNAVTFLSLLRACGSIGAVDKGLQIHHEIARQGLLESNIVLGTALVDMYAKCGNLEKAQQVLEELPIQDVVSWSALIAGYAERGQGEQALNSFEQMQRKGLSPDAVTFLCTLKACGSIRAADKGGQIHAQIARQGLLGKYVALGTALVDMYAKCGYLAKAQQVLEELPIQDVISWSVLLAQFAEQGHGEQALNCFEQMQREGFSPDMVTFLFVLKACGSIGAVNRGEQIHDEIARQGLLGKDTVLGNALVDMYAKCGALGKAQQVFEELPIRDVVSWSALIAGYSEQSQVEQAFNCFEQMQHEGISPNPVTFLCILKACGSIGAADKGEQIHHEIVRQRILGRDIVLGTALVDMYAKCGALVKARQVLEELPVQDVFSWSALIAGYAQHGQAEQALYCFDWMQCKGVFPNAVTFLCILKACCNIGAANRGEQIHDEILRRGLLGDDIVLGNALVDMYAKCGALEKAQQVFDDLPVRDVVSWSALITGYTKQGQGEQAFNCFEQMQYEGISPNTVTFLCILKACGTIGAADSGKHIHDEIARRGLLGKDIVLGTALVDMYAKCGAVVKAQQVLEELPVQDAVSWSVLIAGYAQQGQAEQAFNSLNRMQREGVSPDMMTFSSILKACGSIGLVDDAQMYFVNMSTKYGIKPGLKHFCCMVDVLVRAGHFDRALEMIQAMPYFKNSNALQNSLLSACKKWGGVGMLEDGPSNMLGMSRTRK